MTTPGVTSVTRHSSHLYEYTVTNSCLPTHHVDSTYHALTDWLEYTSQHTRRPSPSLSSAAAPPHRRTAYAPPPLAMRAADDPPRRGPGVCAMRGSCGRASMFGAELPCPDDGDATEVSDGF
jgi:hypothetical protein